MADNKRERCGLKEFFYHEYDLYMDLAKLSEENRDKYFRMYLITISALIGYATKLYYDIGSKTINGLNCLNCLNDRFLITIIIILALIFSLSFIMAMILISGRIGNVKSKKRLNILRKCLVMMECKKITELKDIKVEDILLDTTSDEPKYWKCKSLTGTLIITVIAVMIFCSIAIILLANNFRNEVKTVFTLIASFLIFMVLYKIYKLEEKDKVYMKDTKEKCEICQKDIEEEEKLKKAENSIYEKLQGFICYKKC